MYFNIPLNKYMLARAEYREQEECHAAHAIPAVTGAPLAVPVPPRTLRCSSASAEQMAIFFLKNPNKQKNQHKLFGPTTYVKRTW